MLLVPLAAAEPTFDVPHGVQDYPFDLTITGNEGGKLYYSVDGSEPTVPYTGPLRIITTTMVRAVEVGSETSPTVTSTYVFPEHVLLQSNMDQAYLAGAGLRDEAEQSLRDLPTISIVAPTGLSLSEVPASFEWIDPAGDDTQVNCGAYVSGGTSYVYEKTSIRVVFRDEYGAGRLHADLYKDYPVGIDPVTSFDALSLRSGNHDTVFYLGAQGQHLRNFFMDETQLEQGQLAPHGRFAHLYVNGSYNGAYHVRERFNAAMMATYLGGGEDDYEAINGGSAFDGSGSAWAALVAASYDWTEAQRWLDVEDFLDYMVLQYYAANAWDWAYWHNWIAAGPATIDAGGFRFHSSDSDICLYYGYDTNILSLGGPSNIFLNLLSERDPDFVVALKDAIYRNLSGPLAADAAGERYARLAAQVEGALVAESARFGYGWWDRDGEWVTERDRLLNDWFPYRTDAMWSQFRAAGWYDVEAPEIDTPEGLVAAGTVVTVSAPESSTAELWVTLDGEDPRVSGGALAASALGPDGARAITVDRSTVVKARLREGETWGPIVEGFYEVDAAPPVVLNEWNAVEDDEWLGGDEGDGADDALGRLPGNGGDWVELLILEDVDLRGWRIEMEDKAGDAGTLTFSDVEALSALRAGTILTIAADLPEDLAYAPDGGDWRLHLGLNQGAITGDQLRVSHADWQLTLFDADGAIRFGPAGEGIGETSGIGKDEVGVLEETPGDTFRRTNGDWRGETRSTFGAPNVWEDGAQDLDGLRGLEGGIVEVDSATGDSGGEGPSDDPEPRPDAPDSCGCQGSPGSSSLPGLLLLLPLLRRRR